jgi:hypothetical protein
MTKHELIDAYAKGRIGRRDFVNRLTGMGISAAAAVAYAANFAPMASAAGGQTQSGYKVRFQDAQFNDEYGTPIGVCQALDVLVQVVQRLIDRLNSMASLNRGLRNVLRRMRDRLSLLEDLQQTYCGTASGGSLRAQGLAPAQFAQSDSKGEKQERLDLLTYIETVAGLYTYLVPTVDDIEARTSLMSVAMAISREAGAVREIIGEEQADDLVMRPIPPDEALQTLDRLDAGQTV